MLNLVVRRETARLLKVKVGEMWNYSSHFMWRLSSCLPQNSVPSLERPVGKCCTGEQWSFILRFPQNTWIYLDNWQHAVLPMIKRKELKHRQNNRFITQITCQLVKQHVSTEIIIFKLSKVQKHKNLKLCDLYKVTCTFHSSQTLYIITFWHRSYTFKF
jgi:hypothetical protein